MKKLLNGNYKGFFKEKHKFSQIRLQKYKKLQEKAINLM